MTRSHRRRNAVLVVAAVAGAAAGIAGLGLGGSPAKGAACPATTTTAVLPTSSPTTLRQATTQERPIVVRGNVWYYRASQTSGNADGTITLGDPDDFP